MSVVGEVLQFTLELVVDSITSWRMAVTLAATAFVIWLILDYGPQGTVGTIMAILVAIAGFVLGLRWERAADPR